MSATERTSDKRRDYQREYKRRMRKDPGERAKAAAYSRAWKKRKLAEPRVKHAEDGTTVKMCINCARYKPLDQLHFRGGAQDEYDVNGRYTTHQLAPILGITKRQVNRRIQTGVLPATKEFDPMHKGGRYIVTGEALRTIFAHGDSYAALCLDCSSRTRTKKGSNDRVLHDPGWTNAVDRLEIEAMDAAWELNLSDDEWEVFVNRWKLDPAFRVKHAP